MLRTRLLYIFVLITAITGCHQHATDLIGYIDTRVGTAPNSLKSAGKFGKGSEELGQTLPAVFEPNGMNFWTPQTQDTEVKCKAPYYYQDSLFQGFRNSHWIVGGCTQDYGSMTLFPATNATIVCRNKEPASSTTLKKLPHLRTTLSACKPPASKPK